MQLTTTTTTKSTVEQLTKSGFLMVKMNGKSGAQRLVPMSRVEYRKANGFGNAESKRKYAEMMSQFTACAAADFAYHAQTMHVKGVNVSKSGTRKYTLGNQAAVVVTRSREMTEVEMLAALGVSADDVAAIKMAKK